VWAAPQVLITEVGIVRLLGLGSLRRKTRHRYCAAADGQLG